MKSRLFLLCSLLLLATCTTAPQQGVLPAAHSPQKISAAHAEILILGDSQISFGAGAAYTAFFNDLPASCGISTTSTTKAVGVRSTALHHWTANSGPARGPICDVDPTYGVNAGAYGVTSPGRTYVQIGMDPSYPYCPANRSALEAAISHIDPGLVVLSFLGNATERWQSATTAQADWRAATAQLPAQTPCLVMTTIPAYEARENARRKVAQSNLAAAVKKTGRCAFVSGLTAQTIAAIQGQADNFRTDETGRVIDPRHPTKTSAERFIAVQKLQICAALRTLLPQN